MARASRRVHTALIGNLILRRQSGARYEYGAMPTREYDRRRTRRKMARASRRGNR